MDENSTAFDILLVGGGLQNGLIALALRKRQPGLRLCVIERDGRLGGNHTWCFHDGDVSEDDSELICDLVVHSWPEYRVRFPRHERDLATPYAMITSERLHEVVSRAVAAGDGCVLETDVSAVSVTGSQVELADGRILRGRIVIDARGPDRLEPPVGKVGYQKFVGLEVCTQGAHGVSRPLLMDAQVEQIDGFRFLYVLPLGPDRLLLEDTRFSDNSHLEPLALRRCVEDYAQAQGYAIARVVRQEQGVLPLTWTGGPTRHAPGTALRAGYGGQWFHPVTGYSFPVALRLASYVSRASLDELEATGFDSLRVAHKRQMAFAFRLNKMLFTWFKPSDRFQVLERFYTLDEAVIRRFYALQSTALDRARILIGRPPRGMSYKAAIFGRTVS